MPLPNHATLIARQNFCLTWHKPWCDDDGCDIDFVWADAVHEFGWLYVSLLGLELSVKVGEP